MSLSKNDIVRLAQLAKLALSDEEIKIYQRQLVKVLDYIHKINELKLDKVPESLSGVGETVVGPRPDAVEPSQPDVIKQAAELRDDLVVSPQVFER